MADEAIATARDAAEEAAHLREILCNIRNCRFPIDVASAIDRLASRPRVGECEASRRAGRLALDLARLAEAVDAFERYATHLPFCPRELDGDGAPCDCGYLAARAALAALRGASGTQEGQ